MVFPLPTPPLPFDLVDIGDDEEEEEEEVVVLPLGRSMLYWRDGLLIQNK